MACPTRLSLRVAVVADETLVRELVFSAINGIPGMEVAGSCGNERTALAGVPPVVRLSPPADGDGAGPR